MSPGSRTGLLPMPDIPGNSKVSRRLAAIVAADIAGYSALMGTDEEATVRDLKAHQAVVLPMIAGHGGRIIDTAGDGILAEFASVVNAVECAVAIQKTMAERNAGVEASRQMQFRIGVNLGDILHDGARVYGDGVNIAVELSRFSSLFVIARNSSFTYKGRAVDVRQVARELGVRYVLEGSVRRAGDRVRITAQLIDANTGMHRWAERYDRELKDIFAVQNEVAYNIVAVLVAHVNKAEIERAKRKPTESLDAYDFYLRGLAEASKITRQSNDEALRLYHKAIELDPDFSTVHGAATMCFARRRTFGWVIDRDREIAEVRRLAQRVLHSGKSDAIALALAGYALAYVVGELDEAVSLIDPALAFNPNLAAARSTY